VVEWTPTEKICKRCCCCWRWWWWWWSRIV